MPTWTAVTSAPAAHLLFPPDETASSSRGHLFIAQPPCTASRKAKSSATSKTRRNLSARDDEAVTEDQRGAVRRPGAEPLEGRMLASFLINLMEYFQYFEKLERRCGNAGWWNCCRGPAWRRKRTFNRVAPEAAGKAGSQAGPEDRGAIRRGALAARVALLGFERRESASAGPWPACPSTRSCSCWPAASPSTTARRSWSARMAPVSLCSRRPSCWSK